MRLTERQHFDIWDPTERSDNALQLSLLRSCVEDVRVDAIAQFQNFEPTERFQPSISPAKAYRRQE